MDNTLQYPHNQTSNSKNSRSHTSSHLEAHDPKTRYIIVNKQEKANERIAVRDKIKKQNQKQQKKKTKYLKNRLNRTKKQLKQLQKTELQVVKVQAFKKAQIKKINDKIIRKQKQQKKQNQKKQANQRYLKATIKTTQMQSQINMKKTMAVVLRDKHKQISKKSRSEAKIFINKYNKQKALQNEQQQKKKQLQLQFYRNNLNKLGVNVNNKIQSNKVIIKKQIQNTSDNAIVIGQYQFQKIKQEAKEKLRLQKHNRNIAKQRGKSAASKIKLQKQYDQYCVSTQQDQIKLNLQRLQAGRRNQYVGVKPLTLSQIQANKKAKSQKQFQQLFMNKHQVKKVQQNTSKYAIIQQKLTKQPQYIQQKIIDKQNINYAQNESLIPQQSQGRYSFQSSHIQPKYERPKTQTFGKQVQKQNIQKEDAREQKKDESQQQSSSAQIIGKNR